MADDDVLHALRKCNAQIKESTERLKQCQQQVKVQAETQQSINAVQAPLAGAFQH